MVLESVKRWDSNGFARYYPSLPVLKLAFGAVAVLSLIWIATINAGSLYNTSNDAAAGSGSPVDDIFDPRPVYAIAHRVLHADSVSIATSHGANAIETDMRATRDGWFADHDMGPTPLGSPARDLFMAIANERKKGAPIGFVWFDLKNPDECGAGERCSIEALRDVARETLEPAGVKALFGFFGTEGGRSYHAIRTSLNPNEALMVSGFHDHVLKVYNETAENVPVPQRLMDYGTIDLSNGFGDCYEDGGLTCTELRQGSQARGDQLGKVLGWTSGKEDTEYVHKLLKDAQVDGIIYGYTMADYGESPDTRAAANDFIDFVKKNNREYRMAEVTDAPW